MADYKCAGCGRPITNFTDDWECRACGCITAERVRAPALIDPRKVAAELVAMNEGLLSDMEDETP